MKNNLVKFITDIDSRLIRDKSFFTKSKEELYQVYESEIAAMMVEQVPGYGSINLARAVARLQLKEMIEKHINLIKQHIELLGV